MLHWIVNLCELQRLRSRDLRKNFNLRQNIALLHRAELVTWSGWSHRFRYLQRQPKHDFRYDEFVSCGGARGLCEATTPKIWNRFF